MPKLKSQEVFFDICNILHILPKQQEGIRKMTIVLEREQNVVVTIESLIEKEKGSDGIRGSLG